MPAFSKLAGKDIRFSMKMMHAVGSWILVHAVGSWILVHACRLMDPVGSLPALELWHMSAGSWTLAHT